MTAGRKFIAENLRRALLREYIKKEVGRAGFGAIDTQRTPLGTRVTIFTEKPGLIIGKEGKTVKRITDTIEQKFKFENPQIAVEEIKTPALNPHLMAQKLAESLERGWNFRRAGHSIVERIMSAGARGCQVIISGKITGERHKSAKFSASHIKYCGEPAELYMKEGYATALTKPGIIGVKVKIMPPDVKLPDEISILHKELEVPKKAVPEVPLEKTVE
ncbi:MAG: 30S ribosomal protein S3 [Candidatus Thermoplasmatota archaeon]|nr:30S ribosomal protein S3 [Candidatus Thermoplasmatota archaeon]